jgi:hypothetical protein
VSDRSLTEGSFHGGVLLETCRESRPGKVSRPRVRPIEEFGDDIRVEFPRKLREDFPIGTRFTATVKVCQKHNRDGSCKGDPYLKAYDISLVHSSVKDKGLVARVRAGSISGLAYEYVQTEGKWA